ncbi:hypothetical protein ACSBPU_15495 [Parapusillimonas sp. JC17]|uniref:hypothetical protein n=1 Tax=Parapusillimonas sp. JC17 TaxID=3445768 RepID=UPI003FA13099
MLALGIRYGARGTVAWFAFGPVFAGLSGSLQPGEHKIEGLTMSYGTIVNELARLLDIPIIAYDNIPHRGGCILYLDGPVRRIDIDTAALDQGGHSY